MKQKNRFGAAFRVVRLARGLTQEDFAEQSGRTYVSEVERGLKHPTLQKIDELAVPLALHPLTPIFLAYLKHYDMASCEELLRQLRNEVEVVLPCFASGAT
jgi:transcriptional regulator with XRE-family HTH domain